MPLPIDHRYLENEQYIDASRINDRIQLHLLYSTNKYGWFRWVFDQLELSQAASILEIGSGPGMLWSENLDRIPPGSMIILADYSPGMLHDARVKLTSAHHGLRYSACNAMALPFPDQFFDAIVANHMLYHVPDIPLALSEISRVLKHTGIFLAATNGANHLVEISDIMESFSMLNNKNYSPTLNVEAFTLENGSHQLTTWFEKVSIRMYDDELVVTDPGPLLAYICSMIPISEFVADPNLAVDLSNHLHHLFQQNNPIHIQKCTGLFVCDKGKTMSSINPGVFDD